MNDTGQPKSARRIHKNSNMDKDLARNLRAWRKFRKLTQEALAHRLGVSSNSAIAALENMHAGASLERWREIAEALGITLPELMVGPQGSSEGDIIRRQRIDDLQRRLDKLPPEHLDLFDALLKSLTQANRA